MKVLVVSHTVFSESTNMGKTLLSYFKDFKDFEIAQFYIHSEVPTNKKVCKNYYRFTDIDAMKSIFVRCKGRKFKGLDVQVEREDSRVDRGVVEKVYNIGSRRHAWVLCARDFMWKLSKWKTDDLKKWLDEFCPDVIFFASGEYSFIYHIANYIADYTNKPLVIACVDDHYIHNRYSEDLLGKIHYKSFMKIVNRTMEKAKLIFTICDSMNMEYRKLFDKECFTLHTSVEGRELEFNKASKKISYIGNLEFGRTQQLLDIGKAISKHEGRVIDVYSATKLPEEIEPLKNAEGIAFHGAISAIEVLKVMEDSMAVIHTESFDENIKKVIRFSVSTKIAETLRNGPCLIVYGPRGIASIDYLLKHDAAYVILSPEELEDGLSEIITNAVLRGQIVSSMRDLAEKNHKSEVISVNVRKRLQQVVEDD